MPRKSRRRSSKKTSRRRSSGRRHHSSSPSGRYRATVTPPRTLLVCHGRDHPSLRSYPNADTLDSEGSTNPTFVADLTQPLPVCVPRHAYDRIVLPGCPSDLLFHNTLRAHQPLFRDGTTRIPLDIAVQVEIVLGERPDSGEVVVDVDEAEDGTLSVRNAQSIESVRRSELIEVFFHWRGKYWKNQVILSVDLDPVEQLWKNLAELLVEDREGRVIVRAPMPRIYALMHGRCGRRFKETLRDIAGRIARKTGLPWEHAAIKNRTSYCNYVVPEMTRLYEFESYDWHLVLKAR